MIMFFIRTTFWLSIVVWLVPVGKDKLDATVTHSVSSSSAIELATGALSDLAGFCGRNPDVCEEGHAVFEAFAAKAKVVAGMALAYINDKGSAASAPDGVTTAPISGKALKSE
ncbi:MAG: DUF5330 domain-containing protein [Rhizobiales bacterium]|nr:DUF5330 domain-containing protein [Hyphomicrobiales bacterium]